MKYRESSMPDQAYWETLFDVDAILHAFAIGSGTGAVAELGCGYGTFTIPVALRTRACVHAYDIEPAMVETTLRRAGQQGLSTVVAETRDVFASGFGLPDSSCGACLLFNILHGEQPAAMLREAHRIVRDGGIVAVIHWRSDIATPRGPSVEIRPRAEQIVTWASSVRGLILEKKPFVLPPWHFGVSFAKAVTG